MGATKGIRIYFSDIFEVDPSTLEDFEAFDVSLLKDLPLFVDPFLLFHSSKPEYKALHNEIIRYVAFLRDKSVAGEIDDGLLRAWFTFREVKQTWLGYSLSGNDGRGLGMDFARELNANLAKIFTDFGGEAVTEGSHIEKVCLVSDIGRDNISDFATNLIKHYLLEFTERFALAHLHPSQRRRVPVPKARFNYETEAWETITYELPFCGDYVILTPIDMLTKDDVWINKVDFARDYSQIAASVPNEQLRSQLNNYLVSAVSRIQERDERRRPPELSRRRGRRRATSRDEGPTRKQFEEAVAETLKAFPELIDYYIRFKEQNGDEAEATADEKVRSSEQLYVWQVRQLVEMLLSLTGFYRTTGNTLDEARERVLFLKDVIENKGGHRLFYVDDVPIRREADLHILFRLTWCNTPSDVNREVNNGRGPSDFEVSRGRYDKSLIEFKLAKNSSLKRNLAAQVEVYKKASDAQAGLKVIVYFTGEERERVLAILRELDMENDPNVILIDARSDNKPSASKAEPPDSSDA